MQWLSRALAWVMPPSTPHIHTLEKIVVVTGASAVAAVPSSSYGFSLQLCCSSLSCGTGLCQQHVPALEHCLRWGLAGLAEREQGERWWEKGFWKSFHITSPTSFIPVSVPPHAGSHLCCMMKRLVGSLPYALLSSPTGGTLAPTQGRVAERQWTYE